MLEITVTVTDQTDWSYRIEGFGNARVFKGPKGWALETLYVYEWARGQRVAQTLLQAICTDADQAKVCIGLEACPFESDVSLEGLVSLYSQFGFQTLSVDGPGAMMCRPKKE